MPLPRPPLAVFLLSLADFVLGGVVHAVKMAQQQFAQGVFDDFDTFFGGDGVAALIQQVLLDEVQALFEVHAIFSKRRIWKW